MCDNIGRMTLQQIKTNLFLDIWKTYELLSRISEVPLVV